MTHLCQLKCLTQVTKTRVSISCLSSFEPVQDTLCSITMGEYILFSALKRSNLPVTNFSIKRYQMNTLNSRFVIHYFMHLDQMLK